MVELVWAGVLMVERSLALLRMAQRVLAGLIQLSMRCLAGILQACTLHSALWSHRNRQRGSLWRFSLVYITGFCKCSALQRDHMVTRSTPEVILEVLGKLALHAELSLTSSRLAIRLCPCR